jgi:hypothetical protein
MVGEREELQKELDLVRKHSSISLKRFRDIESVFKRAERGFRVGQRERGALEKYQKQIACRRKCQCKCQKQIACRKAPAEKRPAGQRPVPWWSIKAPSGFLLTSQLLRCLDGRGRICCCMAWNNKNDLLRCFPLE